MFYLAGRQTNIKQPPPPPPPHYHDYQYKQTIKRNDVLSNGIAEGGWLRLARGDYGGYDDTDKHIYM